MKSTKVLFDLSWNASSAWSPWLGWDILELEKVYCAACLLTRIISTLDWETLEARHHMARLDMLATQDLSIILLDFSLQTLHGHIYQILSYCYLPIELYTGIPLFLRQSTVGTINPDKLSCQHL